MDEAIDILKKIGVKEINKTTKISINKIEDILEKKFSNVQRVRVVGFLKILEREYKVDLSSWLKEYDERFFVDVRTQDDGKDLAVEPHVSNLYLDTQKQKDDLIEERKKQIISKKRFYILITFVLVVLGGYFLYKSFSHHSDIPHTQVTQETTQSTDTAEEDIDKPTQSAPAEYQDNNQIQTSLDVARDDFDSKENESIQIQAPLKSKVTNEVSDSTIQLSKISEKSDKNIQESEILITPKKSLWVEVIDLNTKEKKQTIIQSDYSIKTGSDSLLISFGHGELTLQNNDERVEYDKAYPLRFLYTPKDGLKQIRYSKYLDLSGQEQ